MRRTTPLLALLAGLALIRTAETAGAQVLFSGLGDLPGGSFESAANAVSADGRIVVGSSLGATGLEAFRWEGGVITGLGDLPGGEFDSTANGVSSEGRVIVGRGRSPSGNEAFRWEDGVMTGLGDLPDGDFNGTAHAVSADGSVIVGVSAGAVGFEAFRWEGGVMEGLGDLPGGLTRSGALAVSADGGVVVGYGDSGDLEAFRWEGGTMAGLGFLANPGPTAVFQSVAYGVSANGSVIVGDSHNRRIVFDPYSGKCVTAVYLEPFRFRDGSMTPLFDELAPCEPLQFSIFGIPLATNADGSVIVGYAFGAFVWDESNGIRDLQEVLESDFGLDLTGWRLDRATGVSADGRVIVGFGRNPGGDQEAWIAMLRQPQGVPAFSPPGLLIVGGLLLATALWAIRRRLPPQPHR